MDISQNGIDLIKRFEGCRLTAYKCPAGVWTIGYGHTGGVHKGLTIRQETADHYLIVDLNRFVNHVNSINVKGQYYFTQNEFDALVSFAFNIGSLNQLTANCTRNKREIADKMLLYNKAGGKVLDGLVKRRQAEHDLFIKVRPTEKKTNEEIALEVLNDKWGKYPTRKKLLEQAGYNYKEIQAIVDALKKGGK